MTHQPYDWKRFFCPREGKVNLNDDGFLYDPESEYGPQINPDVLSFNDIITYPCLIILGEPGIGKTVTLGKGFDSIKDELENEGNKSFWLDLRSYGSDDRLYRDFFNTAVFKNWLSGDHELHIFLDSFDECLIHFKNLSTFLLDQIRKLPIERLRIRIACRTSEWPNSLEKGLIDIWGSQNVGTFEITPLRKSDVVTAVTANGINSDAFLSEVREKNVVPFALNPITLNFFIALFQRDGSLPSNLVDLYYEGCICLCTEFNENLRDIRRTDAFDAEKKLIIASRIANITLLTNKESISLAPLQATISQDEVHINQLSGGSEYKNSDKILIDHFSMYETFNTSLFTSRGPEKLGWAHRSYAEFLAAFYFIYNEVPVKQVLSLLLHHEDEEIKIVPQLHGIAIWLTIMNNEFLKEIINIEPELLLRGSVSTLDESVKSSIVEVLLSLYEEGMLLLREPHLVSNFIKLNNPDMDDIIRSYIFDREKGINVRKLAINIARFCKLVCLENEILELLHDIEQPLELRIYSAFYISDIGSEDAKRTLISLAKGEAGDDPEDELKGYGLITVWPNHIDTKTLFSIITIPKREFFGGAYQAFLLSYLVDKLESDGLPYALKWINTIYDISPVPYIFESLADQIILKAIDHLTIYPVLESLALTTWVRISNFKPFISNRFAKPDKKYFEDDSLRKILIVEMSRHYSKFKENVYALVHSDFPLIFHNDIEWLIQKLHEAEEDSKQFWRELIRYIFRRDDQNHFKLIYYEIQDDLILRDSFSWIYGPIEIESETAQQIKEFYEREQEILRRHEKPVLDPSPLDVVLELLSDFEQGNTDAWIRLTIVMMFEPDGSSKFNYFSSDITSFPVWYLISDDKKYRIIQAAQKFLIERDSNSQQWLGTYTIPHSTLSGFRALRLLFQENIQLLHNLPQNVWAKWVPIILAYPDTLEDSEVKQELINISYNYASRELISILLVLIDIENEREGNLNVLTFLKGIWDSNLKNALLEKVRDTNLRPNFMGRILELLLTYQNPDAEEYAKTIITVNELEQDIDKERRIIASSALIRLGHDSGWSHIWPIISNDDDFGKLVLEAIAVSHFHKEFWTNLELDQVGDLICWVFNHYPPEEDPVHDGVYKSGARDEIASIRNSILTYLRTHGSIEACSVLERLVGELPQYPWLNRLLIEARNIMRIKTWIPPKPEDIMTVIHDRDARFVQNGVQLIILLSESLDRLEQKLQGETPASEFLWDKIEDGRYIPKDENTFSNFVKIHLDEDLKTKGIVVNREVEIRRGEVTDIHIDAILVKERTEVIDILKAIIEVKCCWHPELKTAMETQLIDRYLRENQTKYGMYLVGWYLCDKWTNDDYKKRNCSRMSKEEIRRHLDAQAMKLSEQKNTYVKSKIVNVTLR